MVFVVHDYSCENTNLICFVQTICLVTRLNRNSLYTVMNCTELISTQNLIFIKVQVGDKDMHVNMIFKGLRLR